MDFERSGTILVTCPRGLVESLETEVRALELPIESIQRASVTTTGTLMDCLRLNLACRTALHVNYLLDSFTCRSPDELYRQVNRYPWENVIEADGYLSVTSRVDHPTINNSMFPSLKTKDAIVDRIASARGRRPDAGPKTTGVVVSLFWRGDRARVYLNTSGAKLADRSYRRIPHQAPMQETLAAAVVMATNYAGTEPFVNPMCGSGTLAIEAGLIGQGRLPGTLRPHFSIMRVIGFDQSTFQRLRTSMRKAHERPLDQPIVVSDHDEKALIATERNARTAGVDQLLRYEKTDFAETPLPSEPGVIVINPEYGVRMGDVDRLRPLYERIGDFFKQRCAGYRGYVFTASRELANHIGLKVSRRMPFYSADLECRLLHFDIYEGSKVRASDESSSE
ncbi:MAG: class I SAM-dependent RNA methyltransferase [Planctomycetota bacterium]